MCMCMRVRACMHACTCAYVCVCVCMCVCVSVKSCSSQLQMQALAHVYPEHVLAALHVMCHASSVRKRLHMPSCARASQQPIFALTTTATRGFAAASLFDSVCLSCMCLQWRPRCARPPANQAGTGPAGICCHVGMCALHGLSCVCTVALMLCAQWLAQCMRIIATLVCVRQGPLLCVLIMAPHACSSRPAMCAAGAWGAMLACACIMARLACVQHDRMTLPTGVRPTARV